MNCAAGLGVNEVTLLGDYADMYNVSSHAKDPRLFQLLTDEIEDVLNGLDELDQAFPRARKTYIEGNHEFRLERYLIDKAPALFGVTDLEHLFKLNSRPNWRFVPYTPHQRHMILGSKLAARHEPLANSAQLTSKKALCNLVFGHVHRIEESHIVGLDGTNHVSFSVGWLGNKAHRAFSYVKNYWQWQLGFGIVHVDPKTKNFYHQKIHILEDYSCVANGKRYKA